MSIILLVCGVIFISAFLYAGDVVLCMTGAVCLMLSSLGR